MDRPRPGPEVVITKHLRPWLRLGQRVKGGQRCLPHKCHQRSKFLHSEQIRRIDPCLDRRDLQSGWVNIGNVGALQSRQLCPVEAIIKTKNSHLRTNLSASAREKLKHQPKPIVEGRGHTTLYFERRIRILLRSSLPSVETHILLRVLNHPLPVSLFCRSQRNVGRALQGLWSLGPTRRGRGHRAHKIQHAANRQKEAHVLTQQEGLIR